MALKKTFILPNGVAGEYITIGNHYRDPVAREASVQLMLYVSDAKRREIPDMPVCMIAKLRLSGTKYDQYLSTAALTALTSPGVDPVRSQIYAAARVEPLLAGGCLTEVVLADAEDV